MKSFYIKFWPILLGSFSGIAYMFGYIKALNFLHSLKVYVLPTEVYSTSSIFMSGLTTLFAGAPLLILSIYIGYVLAHYKIRLRNRYRVILVLLPFSVLVRISGFIGGDWGLNFSPPLYLFGFSLVFYILTSLLYSIMLTIITFRALSCFSNRNTYNLLLNPLFITLLCLWYFLILYGQVHISETVTSGKPPSEYSQEPGMIGYILTKYPIDATSVKINKQNNELYRTAGVLLNHHDNVYYFYNGLYKQSDLSDSTHIGLYLIPESKVVRFHE